MKCFTNYLLFFPFVHCTTAAKMNRIAPIEKAIAEIFFFIRPSMVTFMTDPRDENINPITKNRVTLLSFSSLIFF